MAIDSADPTAIAQYEAKIALLEEQCKERNAINALVRKHVSLTHNRPANDDETAAALAAVLDKYGADVAAEVASGNGYGDYLGMPTYLNENARAEVKRCKGRIADLEAIAPTDDGAEPTWSGPGWNAYIDDNRVCFEVDAMARGRLTRDSFAEHRSAFGAVWSRANGRFQRKDTANGRARARNLELGHQILPAPRFERLNRTY